MFNNPIIDLDDIAEQLEHATRYEGYVVALCPFHSETRPSFFVYPDTYKCASCGAHGRTEQLVNKLKGVVFAPSTALDVNPFTGWLRDRSLGETLKLAWKNLPSAYLRTRGIDDKQQRKLGLGMLDNWITFPIRNTDDKIVGAVARRGENNLSQSKYVIPKGQDVNLLYIPNWDIINRRKTVYLTFGILDAISLFLLGAAAISTTCGMQLNTSYLDSIRKRIAFIPDRGEEAKAQKFAAQLGWRGVVMRVTWGDKYKDINDIFMAGQLDSLLSVLDTRDTS